MSGNTANREAADGRPFEPTLTEVCPHFHAAIELIGKRWSGAIIWALSDGPLRFADLKRAVPGLSDRLLSQRLRELEATGLVERRVEDGKPVRVFYGLTEKGLGLRPAVQAVQEWASDWKESLH
ncbi:MAG: helix-turn-helix transcriptional regulator [Actinomycetota bacterium]|nr:helix-turn-helix transcriptional regulator [Actinomycetota bacterium]